MNATTSAFEARALRSSRDRIAEIIARHPRLTEPEVRQVIDFLKNARHLEIGLLTSNQKLRPKLDAFMQQHKGQFGVTLWEATAAIGAIVAFVMACWLFWEAARPLAGG